MLYCGQVSTWASNDSFTIISRVYQVSQFKNVFIVEEGCDGEFITVWMDETCRAANLCFFQWLRWICYLEYKLDFVYYYSLFQGRWSDIYGRKQLLVLCLLISSIGYAMLAVSNCVIFLLLARVPTGWLHHWLLLFLHISLWNSFVLSMLSLCSSSVYCLFSLCSSLTWCRVLV